MKEKGSVSGSELFWTMYLPVDICHQKSESKRFIERKLQEKAENNIKKEAKINKLIFFFIEDSRSGDILLTCCLGSIVSLSLNRES